MTSINPLGVPLEVQSLRDGPRKNEASVFGISKGTFKFPSQVQSHISERVCVCFSAWPGFRGDWVSVFVFCVPACSM